MVLVLQNWNKFNPGNQMNTETIIYKIKTATGKDVCGHLEKCKEAFTPALDKKVNIAEYSKKIVENSITFEAWANKELAGMIAAYFNDKKNYTGFITNVSLISEYAGKGIASRLLENCIRFAKDKGFKEIVLEVNAASLPAIKLYTKNHFKEISSQGDTKTMRLTL